MGRSAVATSDGERDNMQQFLEAVDRMVTIEYQTDEPERAVTVVLIKSDIDCRHLHLLNGIAAHLESAADALLRASLMLRDHVLGQVHAIRRDPPNLPSRSQASGE
jgi:hypothetical protein